MNKKAEIGTVILFALIMFVLGILLGINSVTPEYINNTVIETQTVTEYVEVPIELECNGERIVTQYTDNPEHEFLLDYLHNNFNQDIFSERNKIVDYMESETHAKNISLIALNNEWKKIFYKQIVIDFREDTLEQMRLVEYTPLELNRASYDKDIFWYNTEVTLSGQSDSVLYRVELRLRRGKINYIDIK